MSALHGSQDPRAGERRYPDVGEGDVRGDVVAGGLESQLNPLAECRVHVARRLEPGDGIGGRVGPGRIREPFVVLAVSLINLDKGFH